MRPSDDLSPPRRPIFFPVVIATVFLTIIGLTGGFVLGERRQSQERAGLQQPQQQSTVTRPPAQDTRPAPTRLATGSFCPPETRQTAKELGLRTDLRQVFKIQTSNGTTVWICADGGGRLYYQGKTGGLDAELRQRANGLFLTDVQEREKNDYLATAANGNQFLVNTERLEVRKVDGSVETYEVIASE